MAIFTIAFDFDGNRSDFEHEYWANSEKEAKEKAWRELKDDDKNRLASMEVVQVVGNTVW